MLMSQTLIKIKLAKLDQKMTVNFVSRMKTLFGRCGKIENLKIVNFS